MQRHPRREKRMANLTADEVRKMRAYAITNNGGRTYHREDIQEGSELWFLREILAQLIELNENIRE